MPQALVKIGTNHVEACSPVEADEKGIIYYVKVQNSGTSDASLSALEFVTADGLTVVEASIMEPPANYLVDAYPPESLDKQAWDARIALGRPDAIVAAGGEVHVYFAVQQTDRKESGTGRDLILSYTQDNRDATTRSSGNVYTLPQDGAQSCD